MQEIFCDLQKLSEIPSAAKSDPVYTGGNILFQLFVIDGFFVFPVVFDIGIIIFVWDSFGNGSLGGDLDGAIVDLLDTDIFPGDHVGMTLGALQHVVIGILDGDVVVTMHVISCFSSENYRSRYGI